MRLARFVRRGRIVNPTGPDAYQPFSDRAPCPYQRTSYLERAPRTRTFRNCARPYLERAPLLRASRITRVVRCRAGAQSGGSAEPSAWEQRLPRRDGRETRLNGLTGTALLRGRSRFGQHLPRVLRPRL